MVLSVTNGSMEETKKLYFPLKTNFVDASYFLV
jgi:hypothetical protein